MKPTNFFRYRRRRLLAKLETTSPRKADAEPFFGEHSSPMFFQPAVNVTPGATIQREAKEKEKEEPAIPVPSAKAKEEEKEKVSRVPEENEEEQIQRRAKKEEEEEKVQRKHSGPASLPGNNVTNYIHSLNGKGKTLPVHAQYFFAARTGYDFSNVKVHTDSQAARSAQELNAKAYTVGNNIVFNEGQYDTESTEGKKLMAHELTHVVQQCNCVGEKIQHTATANKPAE